jgi:peptidoglycan/xylan/chitin deacetylase (PgdA/CDA1 family)
VDVEEWYHSCWVPEYVRPDLRPPLTGELDRLLPEMLDLFAALGTRATFFVLGEVAARLPGRVREIAAAGHEVACHGHLHLRTDDRSVAAFRRDLALARDLLTATLGSPVVGYRAPEWSLRHAANPRLRVVAELGFRYDSSLAPSPGAGRRRNARGATWLRWPDAAILELPPLVWGGALGLPAGGWCGRLAPDAVVRRAMAAARPAVLVVHPWELIDRPLPGLYTGFARFFHEAGRRGFGERFARRLQGVQSRTLAEVAAAMAPAVEAERGAVRPVSLPRERLVRAGAGG